MEERMLSKTRKKNSPAPVLAHGQNTNAPKNTWGRIIRLVVKILASSSSSSCIHEDELNWANQTATEREQRQQQADTH